MLVAQNRTIFDTQRYPSLRSDRLLPVLPFAYGHKTVLPRCRLSLTCDLETL